MTWGPALYILFILVFFCITIPAAVAAYWCWAYRRSADGAAPILTRFAIFLAALAYDCLSKLVATGFGFVGPRPVYSVGYAVVYWQGQLVLAIATIVLVKYLVSGGKRDSE